MNEMSHDELLSAYLDGELSADQQAEVERRLASDPRARQLVDDLRALRATLQELPEQSLDEDLAPLVLRLAERRMLTEAAEAAQAAEAAEATEPAAAAEAHTAGQPLQPTPAAKARRVFAAAGRHLLNPRGLAWAAAAVLVAVLLWMNEHGRQRQIVQAPTDHPPAERGERQPPVLRAAPEAGKEAEHLQPAFAENDEEALGTDRLADRLAEKSAGSAAVAGESLAPGPLPGKSGALAAPPATSQPRSDQVAQAQAAPSVRLEGESGAAPGPRRGARPHGLEAELETAMAGKQGPAAGPSGPGVGHEALGELAHSEAAPPGPRPSDSWGLRFNDDRALGVQPASGLMLVYCDLSSAGLQNRTLDNVLLRNGIVFEAEPQTARFAEGRADEGHAQLSAPAGQMLARGAATPVEPAPPLPAALPSPAQAPQVPAEQAPGDAGRRGLSRQLEQAPQALAEQPAPPSAPSAAFTPQQPPPATEAEPSEEGFRALAQQAEMGEGGLLGNAMAARALGRIPVEAVYVEATPEQIEKTLSELAAQHNEVVALSVQPAPGVEAQRELALQFNQLRRHAGHPQDVSGLAERRAPGLGGPPEEAGRDAGESQLAGQSQLADQPAPGQDSALAGGQIAPPPRTAEAPDAAVQMFNAPSQRREQPWAREGQSRAQRVPLLAEVMGRKDVLPGAEIALEEQQRSGGREDGAPAASAPDVGRQPGGAGPQAYGAGGARAGLSRAEPALPPPAVEPGGPAEWPAQPRLRSAAPPAEAKSGQAELAEQSAPQQPDGQAFGQQPLEGPSAQQRTAQSCPKSNAPGQFAPLSPGQTAGYVPMPDQGPQQYRVLFVIRLVDSRQVNESPGAAAAAAIEAAPAADGEQSAEDSLLEPRPAQPAPAPAEPAAPASEQ